jgi:hypothetical protein
MTQTKNSPRVRTAYDVPTLRPNPFTQYSFSSPNHCAQYSLSDEIITIHKPSKSITQESKRKQHNEQPLLNAYAPKSSKISAITTTSISNLD